eukprot:3096507-Rhodomonas_salina.9
MGAEKSDLEESVEELFGVSEARDLIEQHAHALCDSTAFFSPRSDQHSCRGLRTGQHTFAESKD